MHNNSEEKITFPSCYFIKPPDSPGTLNLENLYTIKYNHPLIRTSHLDMKVQCYCDATSLPFIDSTQDPLMAIL